MMRKADILIRQQIESVIEIRYKDIDDLQKQVLEMELMAKNYLCSKRNAAIKHSKVYIAAGTPRN
jgi:hypothetical protein